MKSPTNWQRLVGRNVYNSCAFDGRASSENLTPESLAERSRWRWLRVVGAIQGTLGDEINKSSAEAQRMGIQGTPTFFIGAASADGEVTNLRIIIGTTPYDAFKSAIEDVLAAEIANYRSRQFSTQ